MKKVCMIVPSFTAKGGIAAVVNGYRNSELERKYTIHYIETYCDGGKLSKLFKALTAYLRFIKELVCFKPDLIHIHSSFGASFYRKLPFIWIGSILKIPVVNHIHGSEVKRFYCNASSFEKSLKRKAYQSCSGTIALTEEWKHCFEELFCLRNVEVVNNYGEVCEFTPEREEGNVVLYLGFLSKLKGCLDIPQIAQKVKQEVGSVRFVLAGTGEEECVEQLERLVHEYKLEENVILPGWIKGREKEEMLRQASLFFLPSYTEAMPMSILEGMGYGLPVVSSNVGGIPELVESGRNGYLCEPGDTEAFAGAIIRLLKDEQLRVKMGKESVNIIRERFSFESHAEKLMQIYEKAMGEQQKDQLSPKQ